MTVTVSAQSWFFTGIILVKFGVRVMVRNLGLELGTSDGGFRRAPCARGLVASGVKFLEDKADSKIIKTRLGHPYTTSKTVLSRRESAVTCKYKNEALEPFDVG